MHTTISRSLHFSFIFATVVLQRGLTLSYPIPSDTASSQAGNPMAGDGAPTTNAVMVTGANGFLASYIVRDLLQKGHTVHACVRDATREESVQHLWTLPGASEGRLKLFTTGDLATADATRRPFDVPMKDCAAVFHAATALSTNIEPEEAEQAVYRPAMTSTQELLACIERHSDTVKCLILTSSMSSVAPIPEPPIKDESHWSNPQTQRERGNWYGCAKTSQEKLVREWFHSSKADQRISKDFLYAAICPTYVIGPLLKAPSNPEESVGGSMGVFQSWLRGGLRIAPNDSMSFVHVEDCARQHTRILEYSVQHKTQEETINEHCRYMSVIESLHWNEILDLVKQLHPALPEFQRYEGTDMLTPTKFNHDNMNSLQVPVRTTKETLKDSIEYLKSVGGLD